MKKTDPKNMYHKSFEHDSCGVGFVANISGKKENQIIKKGITVLKNLSHRGATAADTKTGDGAGVLIQIPKILLKEVGDYKKNIAIGMIFSPQDKNLTKECKKIIEETVSSMGLDFLKYRAVPICKDVLSKKAQKSIPQIFQVFIGQRENSSSFETILFILRKRIENRIYKLSLSASDFYICSLSSKTIVYKGLLMAHQIEHFYKDLSNERVKSSFCIVHQRYSTNTFPKWHLAQPFRTLAHNGEINTVKLNISKMKQREANFSSVIFGDKIKDIFPIISKDQSDSASLDNAVEFFYFGGRTFLHTMMMLIPQAWGKSYNLGSNLKGFFEYHAGFMEPWDGPAAIAFSDGNNVGAMLDRNGLRPARYTITKNGFIVLSSETGTLDIPAQEVKTKGQLHPGEFLLVDIKENRVKFNDEIKNSVARAKPYRRWVKENRILLHGFFDSTVPQSLTQEKLIEKLRLFGYTTEELDKIITPMAETGYEPTGSMGYDASLAILSSKSQLLYNYFKQLFAQVTNPAIDPIRERVVMSLLTFIGRRGNVLNESPINAHLLEMKHPILTDEDCCRIKNSPLKSFLSYVVPIYFLKENKSNGKQLKVSLLRIEKEVEKAIEKGYCVIILSDKNIPSDCIPIPMLLATSFVASFLEKCGKSEDVSIVVETGEAREVMHFALLLAYGATAINPYLAIATIVSLVERKMINKSSIDAVSNYIQSINKGLLKVMSKMGISTLRSYKYSKLFEAVGLEEKFVNRFFNNTISRIGGIGLKEIEKEALKRYKHSKPKKIANNYLLVNGGDYRFRVGEENHLWTPETISKLQFAVRNNSQIAYDEYKDLINLQQEKLSTLRGLFKLKFAKVKTPIDEVESVENILKRFVSGAMSFGSISDVAHQTICLAMNSIGAKSNSGEGGEDPKRFYNKSKNLSSAIKQIASGRFGVTSEYLANAQEIQIKIAQGAKPGEGGQLPGHKVDKIIAKVRHSTPGVTLISPPPHHDIYSIEDLSQLIYDLKAANPKARVSVKLVAELGVGTVAVGVAKANSDVILISGYDGGTGASPLSSTKHTGIPWEMGLAETQQTLLMNNLRSKVVVQVDGQIKTGRDVVIGALLGAQEFGFATTLLVAMGCIMMRVCHTNSCPVGIATQDKELKKYFTGEPAHIVNYLKFVANEVREYISCLGLHSFDDLIGRGYLLEHNHAIDFWKTKNLDFSRIFNQKKFKKLNYKNSIRTSYCYDNKYLNEIKKCLKEGRKIELSYPIKNTNRAVGARISYEVAKQFGYAGIKDDSITIHFKGSAGQSFGTFLSKGITLTLEGDANDYVGKGLSGGKIVVFPDKKSTFDSSNESIAGNVILYGATSGTAYFCGRVGERFAIRNSGATCVAEGVGDHCCEYMTGGLVVVLGTFGANFGAGMTGGIAYIFDEKNVADKRCNLQMVDIESVKHSVDIVELKEVISDYFAATKSKKAKFILNNWEECLPKFTKIFPMEYKKILGQMTKEDMQIKRLQINN